MSFVRTSFSFRLYSISTSIPLVVRNQFQCSLRTLRLDFQQTLSDPVGMVGRKGPFKRETIAR